MLWQEEQDLLNSHDSFEACSSRSTLARAAEARARAAIRGLASVASPALLVSHVSFEACSSRSTFAWAAEA